MDFAQHRPAIRTGRIEQKLHPERQLDEPIHRAHSWRRNFQSATVVTPAWRTHGTKT
jgi:hypothetical protein